MSGGVPVSLLVSLSLPLASLGSTPVAESPQAEIPNTRKPSQNQALEVT